MGVKLDRYAGMLEGEVTRCLADYAVGIMSRARRERLRVFLSPLRGQIGEGQVKARQLTLSVGFFCHFVAVMCPICPRLSYERVPKGRQMQLRDSVPLHVQLDMAREMRVSDPESHGVMAEGGETI